MLPKVSRDDLADRIRLRALEIAAGEGDTIDIATPAISELREPTGVMQVYWTLADYQSPQGLGYVKVAAAEMSARFDIEQS